MLLAALVAPLLVVLTVGLTGAAAAGPNNWQVGNLVNLSKGTQIRRGPSTDYCYHTIVPEDNWQVKVIGTRPTTDGLHWYDTSRAAAGDPSGGTGWVNVEQVDQHPGVMDRDNPCAPPSPRTGVTPASTQTTDGGGSMDPLTRLVVWWHSLLLAVAYPAPRTTRPARPGARLTVPAPARLGLWIHRGGGRDRHRARAGGGCCRASFGVLLLSDRAAGRRVRSRVNAC